MEIVPMEFTHMKENVWFVYENNRSDNVPNFCSFCCAMGHKLQELSVYHAVHHRLIACTLISTNEEGSDEDTKLIFDHLIQ